jgi:hypothetical protein
MIQHEDELRNQRLGYLLTLNGLLFAALAFAWRAKHAGWLVAVLAAMGVIIAISGHASMANSDVAIWDLRERALPIEDGPKGGDGAMQILAELQSIPVAFSSEDIKDISDRKASTQDQTSGRDWKQRLQPWRSLPLTLGVAWAVIFILAIPFLSWR